MNVAQKEAKTLRRWNQLTDFITILCWTAHASNGRPQSIVMLSEPGEGKTELLERFRPNRHLAFYSDATYRTVLTVLGDAMRGERTHLVITEFQKVIARRKEVAASTLAIVLQAMEEGVFRVGFGPHDKDYQGARMGMFAATTLTSLHKNPFMVLDLAMNSRAYFVDARGTREELMEIERRIAQGDVRALKPVVLKGLPPKPIPVAIPVVHAQAVREWVREMERARVKTYGLRTYSRFLHTLRGVALKNGRQKVNKSDMDELYTFRRLWLDVPPLPEEIGVAQDAAKS